MHFQLRDYRIKPGEMEDWLSEWTAKVRPLREQFGFEVVGAWIIRGEDRFLSILARDDFEVADRRYYASPERKMIKPDPARHLAGSDQHFVEPVPTIRRD